MTLHNLLTFSPTPALNNVLYAQWQEVKEKLRAHLGTAVFQEFFGEVLLIGLCDTDVVHLSAPDQLIQERIETQYYDLALGMWQSERAVVKVVKLSARTTRVLKPPPHPRVVATPGVVATPQPSPEAQPAWALVLQELQEKGRQRDLAAVPVITIQLLVASYYGISVGEMVSLSYKRPIVRPRQVAMYLARTFKPSRNGPMIGKYFHRNRVTVLLSIRRVAEAIKTDQKRAQDVELLTELLRWSWKP